MEIPDKYVAYKKCEKTINSCVTVEQFSNAANLIAIHYKLYGDNFLKEKLVDVCLKRSCKSFSKKENRKSQES